MNERIPIIPHEVLMKNVLDHIRKNAPSCYR